MLPAGKGRLPSERTGLEKELACKVMTGSSVQGLVGKGLAVGCSAGVSRRETAVFLLS